MILAVTCPNCGKQYDSTLFQFGRKVPCDCGAVIDADMPRRPSPHARHAGLREFIGRRNMTELQRVADRVCVLILNSEYPDIDIRIEMENVRTRCQQLFPDRMELYEMIYESRFQRLWEQFRGED